MKKYFYFVIVIFIVITPYILVGCGDKKLPQNDVFRDDQNIGGNISFYYDRQLKTAVFGGEGEIVPFYNKDIVYGWEKEGNRIGIKIIAPKEIDEFESGWAQVGNKKIINGEFYQIVNGQKSNVAIFYPLVDENNLNVSIEICWQEGFKTQIYHVKIDENTIFSKAGVINN